MVREDKIVVVSAARLTADAECLRQIRGSLWGNSPDRRFLLPAVVSVLLHLGAAQFLKSIRVHKEATVALEKIPERFARLIIEKPLPKVASAQKKRDALSLPSTATESKPSDKVPATSTTAPAPVALSAARKRVAANAARVEESIRNVGALGILSGVGATAAGPSVVDVLGKTGKSRPAMDDFEQLLKSADGLKKVDNINILDAKLVRSKEVTIARREEISDLIAGIGMAKSESLAKKGDFVIQRPESIEGAASTNSKRDNAAINAVVSNNKIGLRMTYEKFLARNPALEGKVTIRFTVAASGSVSTVEILENTTSDTEFVAELIRKIRLWKFEPIEEGEATVTYPFVFRSS